ncbi:MAG: mechanosensitive ion channel family protein [Congregibacter sp.]
MAAVFLEVSLALVSVSAPQTQAATQAIAIEGSGESDPKVTPSDAGAKITGDVLSVQDTVSINPEARDTDIANRLSRILIATDWYEQVIVRVDEGVVFLSGVADSEAHSEWAGQLAAKTQDVVAVVNRLTVRETSPWDFSSTFADLKGALTRGVQSAPLFLIALLLLVLTWIIGLAVSRLARSALEPRVKSLLLRQVVSRAIAIPVFLLGLYIVLQLSGLTNLALTVLGGTGVVGLIIGFGFRDIAENFLSSILISAQRPFAIGDLISVAGHQGFVQRVNTRSTLLMTLEGNHVQIPNSAVYKGTIINYTANPKSRANFSVGIGYDDSIKAAQSTALEVLRDHPAVVDDPEPLVLVDSLGASTVNLSIFFWIDVTEYSQIRVLSAVIRLTKRAFDKAGVSMPDEAREVVFPDGLPIDVASKELEKVARIGRDEASSAVKATSASLEDDESSANESEGDLTAESQEILSQAASARVPEASGENLIADSNENGNQQS